MKVVQVWHGSAPFSYLGGSVRIRVVAWCISSLVRLLRFASLSLARFPSIRTCFFHSTCFHGHPLGEVSAAVSDPTVHPRVRKVLARPPVRLFPSSGIHVGARTCS